MVAEEDPQTALVLYMVCLLGPLFFAAGELLGR